MIINSKKNSLLKVFSLALILSFFPVKLLYASINNYTTLVKIENWLIERKIDISRDQINCRASIPGYYSWFGNRIRLDKTDKLIVPEEFSEGEPTSLETLEKVKDILRKCRSSILYLPSTNQ